VPHQRITLRSYAKVNLGLHILGKRTDGFHEIRTVFQSVTLHDLIEISLMAQRGISFESDCPSLNPQDNLVLKAIHLLAERVELPPGLRIRLHKRIPLGAGLGGGSSNAATTLLGLQRLLEAHLPLGHLFEIGGELGSDVPFFLVGGTAIGLGRGSEIYPLEEWTENSLLLVVPPFSVGTPEAYAKASLTLTKRVDKSMIPVFCFGYLESLSSRCVQQNDFEPVVFERQPELLELRRELIQLGARQVELTGSGAALYALFDSSQDWDRIRKGLSCRDIRLIPTRTLNRVEYHESLVESLQ
jgi:4-diphosphocytidyl-2-C-methyl-D-erythritol kinase